MIAIPGMCPGVVIKGGGGAGGGSGAGGGNGKGRKKGANGQDGEENPEGGEKGSGSCGQGGNGGCTNCGHNVSAGDPVDVLTGKAFTEPKLDLHLPGAFDLRVLRSYSAMRNHLDLGMGYGWTHSLAWTLTVGRRSTVIRAGNGVRVELPKLDVGEEVRQGGWGLIRQKDFYVLRPGNEFIHYFGLVDGAYRLRFVRYRKRGYLSLQYDRGRLARVVDSVGPVLLFESNEDGRIESISVPDPTGVRLFFSRYAYDSEGNLVAVSDGDGNMTRYAYDDHHRMTRLEYPSGITFHFVYDGQGRCIETWGAYPSGVDPALAPDAPAFLHDGSPAKGIYHCKLDFVGEEGDEYTEVIDSVRLRRFFGSHSGKISKAVDARGGVTTREFDDLGRVTSVTDPNNSTWKYEYDRLDEVVQETDPEGNVVTIHRDGAGREIGLIDAEGGQVEIFRDGDGETQAIRIQNGAMQRFAIGLHGRLVERLDERGALHTYEYDNHANLIGYVAPAGGRFEHSYDYWGRRVASIDPMGRTTRWFYTDGGRVFAVEDELGGRTQLRYDSMGNLVERVDPDGAVTSWRYGGLNWQYVVKYPDGSEVTTLHNREGWPLYIVNPAGERHTFEYDPSGLVTRETDFGGRTTEYGYDGMGRLAWYDDGNGKFEIERNKIGQVVAEVAPDDDRAEYAFNRRGELLQATRGGVEFRWTRDSVGLITQEEIIVDGVTYRVDSQRSTAGDCVRTLTSLGHDLSVERDPEGRVAELRTPEGRVLQIERDRSGIPVRQTLSHGATIVDHYDGGLRLSHREVVPADGPTTDSSRPDRPDWMMQASAGYAKRYHYSAASELVNVVSADGESLHLEYDVRRHLLRRERRQAQRTVKLETFRADAAGNYYESDPEATPRLYAAGDQITRCGEFEYVHDKRGYLIEKRRVTANGEALDITKFEWSSWGLLSAVVTSDRTRTEFQYDAFARRISKRTVRDERVLERHHYVWDLVSMLHDVRLGETDEDRAVQTYLYHGNDQITPVAQSSEISTGHGGSRHWTYFVGDIKGLPEALIDGAGNVVGRYEHDAFGRARLHAGAKAETPFRAPGQQEDAETGLFYNRYRYYDPDLGRFISPDPIGLEGGLNTYAYGPNPIAWVDPMGWKHHCITLSSVDDSVVRTSSGYHDAADALKTQPRAHTEQKFVHDLLAEPEKAGPMKGAKYTLLGEMPPCPRCHAAMMRGAKESGADIEYKWKDKQGNVQTLSYEGGTGKPTSSGAQADKLRSSYANETDLHKDWAFNKDAGKSDDTTNDYWGVNGKKGADDAYLDMCSDKRPTTKNVYNPTGEPYWSEDEINAHRPPRGSGSGAAPPTDDTNE
jgi:RHS repeat-associated protein